MIIALVCIAAFIILLIACPLKAEIRVDNLRVNLKVTFPFISVRREYALRWDKQECIVIYRIKKGEKKRIASLKSLLLKKQKDVPEDISCIKALRITMQNRQKRKDVNALAYLNKKSRVRAQVRISIGAGDAYNTALLCGWAAALGGSLCAAFTKNNKYYHIAVKPEFNRLLFSLRADCIIAITPANIILGYIIYKIRARRNQHASD